jgi:hypothetical protein
MKIETQLIEDEIYFVTSKGEEDRGYIYNRRNGEHQFSRQMGSVPFMKQIFVKTEEGNLEVNERKVKITADYLVGAISESINPVEYRRLLQIWRSKRK